MNKGFVEEICSILQKNKVISSQEATDLKKSFANRSQIAFDDFLLEEGLVEKEAILKALSEYYQVPSMDPVGYFFDHYLLIKFPKDVLLRNLILPIEVLQDTILMVAANDPSNENLLPLLGKYVSYDIQFRVAIASEIVESVEDFYDKSLTDLPLDDDAVPEQQKEIEDLAKEMIDESPEED